MIPAEFYRHFKGRHYQVLHVARHSETLEEMVVYKQLYGDGGIWVRPVKMFEEQISHEGALVPRFKFLDEKPEDC